MNGIKTFLVAFMVMLTATVNANTYHKSPRNEALVVVHVDRDHHKHHHGKHHQDKAWKAKKYKHDRVAFQKPCRHHQNMKHCRLDKKHHKHHLDAFKHHHKHRHDAHKRHH